MTTNLNRVALKNLFFTRTAIGVYLTILGIVAGTCTDLANKYDEQGVLRATDWVRAASIIFSTFATQGFVLFARVGANSSLVFTPSYLPGPNKEEVLAQAKAQVEQQDCPPAYNQGEFPGE